MFQVMTSTAKMPTSCWGRYRNVAIVETVDNTYPSMISERARGVIRIVKHYGPHHVGATDRSAYQRALKEAQEAAAALNAAQHKPESIAE